ncbi:MAG: heme NO-binding domain-containing protein [Bacteroidota bacterium]
MKGMVFTEFLEMVEDQFGFSTADKIITNADLASGGVYTAVGTYHHQEMVSLVVNLSKETELTVPQLLVAFGRHLFTRFAAGYGHFFEGVKDSFTFLSSIENYIHIEVRKLYPDAELPSFEVQQNSEQEMSMVYKSERGFADFAQGLIEGCIKHFDEEVNISREDLKADKTEVKFLLTKV